MKSAAQAWSCISDGKTPSCTNYRTRRDIIKCGQVSLDGLEIQGSLVQTRLRSMDFSGRKYSEHKSSGMDFKLGVPSLRFEAR